MKRDLESQRAILDTLARLQAGYGTLRQLMSVLIASHPEPSRLQMAWEARMHEWVDDEMARPFFDLPEYREAYTGCLGSLTQEVDRAAAAADARRTGGDST